MLAVLVCTAFLLLVVERAVSGKLLNGEFYAGLLREHDTYRLLYDQVLVDDRVREWFETSGAEERAGVGYGELAGLARDVVPPEALQRHVEGVLSQLDGYMRGESARLAVYLELGGELDRVTPAVLELVEARVNRAQARFPVRAGCLEGGTEELAKEFIDAAEGFAVGDASAYVPSLLALEPECREKVFRHFYDEAVPLSGLDGKSQAEIGERRGQIREAFLAGESHRAMNLVTAAWLSPLIDEAVVQFRWRLDNGELMGLLARYGGEELELKMRRAAEQFRRWVNQGVGLARTVGWPALIGGSLLQVFVYWPRIMTGVRWLGVTLMAAGGVSLAAGEVARGILANRVPWLVATVAGRFPEFPGALTGWVSETAVAVVGQLVVVDVYFCVGGVLAGIVLYTASLLPWPFRRYGPGQEIPGPPGAGTASEQGDGVDGRPGDVSQLERSQG